MMHHIYNFVGSYPVEEYNSFTGWALDRWVLGYSVDVKERTAYLAGCMVEALGNTSNNTKSPSSILVWCLLSRI